ncbi:MAG: hypothetical protein PHZ09_00910, partial [Eubacteriales bacterium]|nr:hypothetical protein [Eubacteriales bacterium]
MSHRYLTKSLFITAMECPAKLFYSGKPEYANQKIEDSFLMALAEGGFQVGELARCYIHGGCRVAPHDYTEALRQTAGLLKRDRVIIYEAAIRYNDFFIRTDILIKEGSHLELIEVKAKSTDEADEECFLTKSGSVSSAWMPYILDIAFQKYVLRRAFPDFDVSAFLMLADKQARCPAGGLSQKFRIIKDMSGRKRIAAQDLSDAELSEPILCKVNVDGCCEAVYRDRYGPDNRDYAGYADFLADCYKNDIKIKTMPSASCGKCEFTADGDDQRAGLLSGFRTCWKEHFGWQDRDFSEPTIFDIWNLRNKDRFIQQGRVKMSDITINDISFKSKSNPGPGLSAGERQWLQISKAQNNDRTVYIDSDNLKREMESWVYPLHFIDFETTMAAI